MTDNHISTGAPDTDSGGHDSPACGRETTPSTHRVLIVGDTVAGQTLTRLLHSCTGEIAVTLCESPPPPADRPAESPSADRPSSASPADWTEISPPVQRNATPTAIDSNELAVRVTFPDGSPGYYDLVVDATGRAALPAGRRVLTLGASGADTRPDVTAALADIAILVGALVAGATVPDAVWRVRRRRQLSPTSRRG